MRFAPCALVLVTAACGSSGSAAKPDAGPPADGFDRNAMLDHLASQVLLPVQTRFATVAAALPLAITAYCDALDRGPPEDMLVQPAPPFGGAAVRGQAPAVDAARAAWGATVDAWEAADAILVGPAAMDQKTLRDRIYGWPLLSPCGVDRDTVTSFADPASYNAATKLVNVRSLTAVEYLLFTTQTKDSCVTTPAGWDALGANLPRARCRLALAIASDVSTNAAQLATAWRTDGGNYVAQLAQAGRSGSSITSAQAAINQVSDAMFYVDNMVKDMKIAEAAGIQVNACGSVDTPCNLEVELRYADRATQAIRINLVSLRQVFTGTSPAKDGPGFDDFLTALGHGDVATRMVGKLDAAIAAANALPDSFLTALTANHDQVVAAYHTVDMFTDDLKSQFLTLLALEIPDDVATDND
jgi:predicted lipoprotein